ncbi:PREDICTED: CASP-like protein 1D1 [Nelumbo nucifera]|uniref:CASP-like protein n=2 Tax=Nelumbo nucifera TaxID=4432 RepID=A0A1U7Z096_NELNU|nr:PREDICTED: CASP-like protein 1D1 [Nelumbo nucifera]DAD37948.1 TPA_asm: hypothetical protein HUJ06_008589 [Nelumbo nucifera]
MEATTEKQATLSSESQASKEMASSSPATKYLSLDLSLRVLLFASTLVAVVVMVTSKQTELVPVRLLPMPAFGYKAAKFNHSPATIYFVAALSVACLYSIITTLTSLGAIWKPCPSKKFFLLLVFMDLIMLGLVASATGTAGGVAYIGLKGNSHVGWTKICSVYDKFCHHVASSIAISLFASILLVSLVMVSTYALYRRC